MTLAAIVTAVIVLGMLGVLSFTRAAADLVFAGGLTLLIVTGVLDPVAALAGFGNEGLVTVGILYVVAAALQETGGVYWISKRLLGRPRTIQGAQLRLMAPVAFVSAFLNNTPVVAIMIPAIADWAKKNGYSPSKLMIPLSYAAILGGTTTLIGTSTNLVVNGLLLRDEGFGLGMFELALVGVPTAVIGIGAVLLLSRWLLPDRRPVLHNLDNAREYSVEMTVEAGGPLVGKTIQEAGLRHLGQVYLIEIGREDRVLPAVSPNEVLQANDRLVFIGVVDSVVELQRTQGLLPAADQVFKLDGKRANRVMVEAVISNSFPLIGKSIREGQFRTSYGAVVIAVARNGVRLNQKIGDIVLRAGDTLLLEARPAFVARQRNSRDFYLVSEVADAHPLRFERAGLAVGILLAMVVVVAAGWLPMITAALVAAGAMLLSGCLPAAAARRSIDWPVLIVIGAAFGVGRALTESGLAGLIAHGLSGLAGASPNLNLLVLYVVTALFTAVITNNAAAVLMFPIAQGMAETLGAPVLPFAITVMMAASASFMTPIGYQTNLMVMGPGGYRFKDYLTIGLPITVLTAASAVLIIPLAWPL